MSQDQTELDLYNASAEAFKQGYADGSAKKPSQYVPLSQQDVAELSNVYSIGYEIASKVSVSGEADKLRVLAADTVMGGFEDGYGYSNTKYNILGSQWPSWLQDRYLSAYEFGRTKGTLTIDAEESAKRTKWLIWGGVGLAALAVTAVVVFGGSGESQGRRQLAEANPAKRKEKLSWNMYGGGTGSKEGSHGYSAIGWFGEYHVWPPSSLRPRHGYLLQWANTQRQPAPHGGLWHDLGHFRSPQEAKSAAASHAESLRAQSHISENPTRGKAVSKHGGYVWATTFEVVTPESAEQGDFEETGWEREYEDNGTYKSLADLLQDIPGHYWLEWSSSHPSPGCWITSEADQDYSTGADTTYGLHIKHADGSELTQEEVNFIDSKIFGARKKQQAKWRQEYASRNPIQCRITKWHRDQFPEGIEIIDAMTDTALDENEFQRKEDRPGPGESLLPKLSKSDARAWALHVALMIGAENGWLRFTRDPIWTMQYAYNQAVERGGEPDPRHFGHYIAMEAMGHGVSWTSNNWHDNPDPGFEVPYAELY